MSFFVFSPIWLAMQFSYLSRLWSVILHKSEGGICVCLFIFVCLFVCTDLSPVPRTMPSPGLVLKKELNKQQDEWMKTIVMMPCFPETELQKG